MKTLILIRHAKAEEKAETVKDFDRNLTTEGLKDASIMGKSLKSMKMEIDAIVSSPAIRTIQTAEVIHEMLNSEVEINTIKELYMPENTTIFKVVSKFNDHINTVILVGHNPSLNDLVETLTNANIDNFPKAATVGIQLNIERWSKLSKKCGSVLFFETPKSVKKSILI